MPAVIFKGYWLTFSMSYEKFFIASIKYSQSWILCHQSMLTLPLLCSAIRNEKKKTCSFQTDFGFCSRHQCCHVGGKGVIHMLLHTQCHVFPFFFFLPVANSSAKNGLVNCIMLERAEICIK